MPRQMMFGGQQGSRQGQAQGVGRLGQVSVGAGRARQAGGKLSQVQVRRALTKRRSSAYLDAIASIDQLAHAADPTALEKVKAGVSAEFGEEVVTIPGFPSMLGLISACYLGGTYEVHTLTPALSIVQHYHRGEPVPAELEKARNLAASDRYAFIEVYSDFCCCIDEGGNATILDD